MEQFPGDINSNEQIGRDYGNFCQLWKVNTPVAIIQNGTPNAKMVVGTVRDSYYKAQYAGLSNPAVIVVGKVVKLHLSFVTQAVAQTASVTFNATT